MMSNQYSKIETNDMTLQTYGDRTLHRGQH